MVIPMAGSSSNSNSTVIIVLYFQSGYECWCGDSYGRFGTSVNCNSDCPGDKDGGTFCGGGNSLSVYDTSKKLINI